jgi:hypothetical protein
LIAKRRPGAASILARLRCTITAKNSQQTVLLQNLRSVVLSDEHGRQGDDGLQFFALQQLDRLAQAIGAGGGVEEDGGELALADPGDAFTRVGCAANAWGAVPLPARLLLSSTPQYSELERFPLDVDQRP